MSSHSFSTGKGQGGRQSHHPPVSGPKFQVQAKSSQLPHYPFQPLPPPVGPAPYRFNLSQLLSAADVQQITDAGVMICHTVGDTGDYRGQQQDFVAGMMTLDAQTLADGRKPAFFYHLGDVVYFAGDIDKYGDNFYETYKDYPSFIVAISGNHDCQPDDPQDGPVDPTKFPFDGWAQNFMSTNPAQLGSGKTDSGRTTMDLPNVYWSICHAFRDAFIGLCSNVSETEGSVSSRSRVAWVRERTAGGRSWVGAGSSLCTTRHFRATWNTRAAAQLRQCSPAAFTRRDVMPIWFYRATSTTISVSQMWSTVPMARCRYRSWSQAQAVTPTSENS